MLISKKWLQSHFDAELPSMQKIADTLLLHSFEVEGLEEVGQDWVLDIDVLPNRAHDCLCHDGVAKELAGLLSLPQKEERYSPFQDLQTLDEGVEVRIENPQQCYRYSGTLVKNIEVRESPEWLQNRMRSLGQRSINNLVDATNYVMFDLGQPMHVFDADKVVGGIVVRNAQAGEKMTTLTGEEIELLETDLVIADEEKILALAGVKGGNAAEVTAETKNIIIESANFNPISTRKTARRVKILTDASKRYENGITSEKVPQAMSAMLSLVMELASTEATQMSVPTDVYPNPEDPFVLSFTQEHTARLLGFDISREEIQEILEKFNYSYFVDDGVYRVTIPYERLDLRIPEDMIEEIGRLYGYHNIPIAHVDDFEFQPSVLKEFFVAQKLRNYFIEHGFTEIMNYTFVKKGEVELYNPLASDKKALRKNLKEQMADSLDKNNHFADFVGMEQIKLFEIDKVHTREGEKLMCCFGIDPLSKKSRKKYGQAESQLREHEKNISKLFGFNMLIPHIETDENGNIEGYQPGHVSEFEIGQCAINLDIDYYESLFAPTSYGNDDIFMGISKYPYIKRDISFWIDTTEVASLEKAFWGAGAQYLKKVYLFDEFAKEGKTSYAFTLIFQSNEKTLTDKEVEQDMEKINAVVEELDGEIR